MLFGRKNLWKWNGFSENRMSLNYRWKSVNSVFMHRLLHSHTVIMLIHLTAPPSPLPHPCRDIINQQWLCSAVGMLRQALGTPPKDISTLNCDIWNYAIIGKVKYLATRVNVDMPQGLPDFTHTAKQTQPRVRVWLAFIAVLWGVLHHDWRCVNAQGSYSVVIHFGLVYFPHWVRDPFEFSPRILVYKYSFWIYRHSLWLIRRLTRETGKILRDRFAGMASIHSWYKLLDERLASRVPAILPRYMFGREMESTLLFLLGSGATKLLIEDVTSLRGGW